MNRREMHRALRHHSQQLPTPAFNLACAVWRIRPPPESHAECLPHLPSFIQMELDPQAGATDYSFVKQHLLICPTCSKMYLDLLEIAELDATDGLPCPAQIPPPDLGFLDVNDGRVA